MTVEFVEHSTSLRLHFVWKSLNIAEFAI